MWCALGSLISLARPSCCPPFSSGDWNRLYHDGSAVSTPSFAALARNGTAFRKAYVPTPLCAPSRSSMALKVECHLKLEAAHGGAKPGQQILVHLFGSVRRHDAKVIKHDVDVATGLLGERVVGFVGVEQLAWGPG